MSLNKLSAIGPVALALCFCITFPALPKTTKAQDGPQNQRLINIKIEDFPQAFQNKEPVRIIALSLGTMPLKSGEDFRADKDWLRDLRIMVKNVSDQSIRSIILSLDLAEDNLPAGDPAHRVRRIDIH